MLRVLSDLVDFTLRLSFQARCPLCEEQAEANGLCRYCVVEEPLSGPLCPRCGYPLTQEMNLCGECLASNSEHWKSAHSSLWLTDSSKRLLHLAKFQGRWEWLEIFKKTACNLNYLFLNQRPALVPIPIHPNKFISRGFNQAELLCQWIQASHPRLPLSMGLQKQMETSPQSTLKRRERISNLKKSFIWEEGITVPPSVLLVDDVYTTGETLRTCASLLKKKGVQTIYAWTLFRTPKRLN